MTLINSQNNINFKSGPWYANAITNITKLDAFGPIVALEATVDTGRATQAYRRGGKNEARERLIEDVTGGIVWLFGVKLLNGLGDKILNKLYGGNFDVGSDSVLRTPFENFIKKNQGKSFANNKMKVAAVKGAKVLASVLLVDAFIGLVVPRLNQKLTRTLIAKDKEKNKDNNKNGEVTFKGGGLSAINTFTNAIENTNIGKLLSTDAGLISGRMYSARNNDERREIAIRDLGSLYFYMFAATHVGKILNYFESGNFRRLDPSSANIFNTHLEKFIEENGGEMDINVFKEKVLGKKSTDINLPDEIKFESGKLSTWNKIFNKNKEPLKVAKVADLETIFKDNKILSRIKEMSKLQPLRQGEAVITKQQIIDAINIAEINDPKLLDKIFDNYTKGAHKDEFKYVSNDKLYNLKSEMEIYVNNLCKNAKGEKITKELLNKTKNKNIILSGINFAAGFGFAALFLSTLIPKFQYWVTRQKTGRDAFPGTYGLVDDNNK